MNEANATYQVKVNGYEFSFSKEELMQTDIVSSMPGEYNLIRNYRSVNAKVLEADAFAKKMTVEVEGEKFEVEIRDHIDRLLDTMGYNKKTGRHSKEIKAPMPGLVLSISVVEGQEVKEGDRMLILEAMKMENSLIIHFDGKIKKIAVTAGQPVDKGQVLVELE